MRGLSLFDPLNREHPVLLAKTIRRTITSTSNPSFKFALDDTLKNSIIVGLAIRRAAAARLSAGGRALINDTLLAKGFLNIKAGGHDDIFEIPLEYLVHADTVHGPMQYAQVRIENWNLEESGVTFSGTTGAALNEDFELMVIYTTHRFCAVPPAQ